jgi:hypothetical protein
MNILKNKHLILAMFVAPVLAIIAYFAVDYLVSEKPHAAIQGSSYKLVAKSNCRYKSGACTLKNGDIEVHMRAQHTTDKLVELSMYSALPIQNAIISYVTGDDASEPAQMQAASAQGNDWNTSFYLDDPEKSTLRLAVTISDTVYYAETTTVFVDYETSFSRDNFNE